MKKNTINIFCSLIVLITVFASCYKLQKDYDYVKVTIDPHYNMTAKQYLFSRDSFVAGVVNDTMVK